MAFLTYHGRRVNTGGSNVVFNPPVYNLSLGITTTSSNTVIRIPTAEDNQYSGKYGSTYTLYGDPLTYTYDYTVDWGDGSPVTNNITSFNDALASHTYSTPGDYIIKINGLIECLASDSEILPSDSNSGFANFRTALKNVISWGDSGLKTMSLKDCTNLETLPSDGTILFDMENLDKAFYQCSSLQSIPADLLKDSPNLLSCINIFSYCSTLTTIPTGLFDNNINLTNFKSVFFHADNITEIPAGLFDNNTLVADSAFSGTFAFCDSITSVPAGLFDNNVLAADRGFTGTFRNCPNLTTLPSELFRNHVNVDYFGWHSCFLDCGKLQLIPDLFYRDGEQSTRFSGTPTPNFVYMFEIDSVTFTGVQGTAPDLWNIPQASVHADTFLGHSTSSLSNYASVPSDWR